MNRPNLNTLAKEVYEANKLKGFHDKEHSNETLLMLVITELSEAVEADRKGKRADIKRFNEYDNDNYHDWLQGEPNGFNENFSQNIKDTIEDELADSVIRLLDLAGLRKVKIDEDVFHRKIDFSKMNFSESILEIIDWFIISNKSSISSLVNKVYMIEDLCTQMSIDLWLHVELKLKYNQLRPYKHGKEY
uniref:hypothetical protein n=1 Tax=uncultured Dysgonomonas sp. TaxID=206096 RepID=UPI00262A658A|nr:hypothetical protein [uncultured Dysgonomonas sp.]